MERKSQYTILDKGEMAWYTVKSIANFHFFSSTYFVFNAILLLDDSLVIEVKIRVAYMGDLSM